jgi:hypothetical protein
MGRCISRIGMWGRTCVMVAAVAAMLLIIVPAGRASAQLPTPVANHMDDLTQWAYRNGATTSAPTCGSVCSNLWESEHGPIPDQPTSQTMWDELTSLMGNSAGAETPGVALWPDFAAAAGEVGLAVGAFEVGWHIGGVIDKWLGINVPAASGPVSPGFYVTWSDGPSSGDWGPTYDDQDPYPKGWIVSDYNLQNIVWQYNPTGAPAGCAGGNAAPVAAPDGWTAKIWHWNDCFVGNGNPLAPQYAEGFYVPASEAISGPPGDYNGQTADEVIQSNGIADPGYDTTKQALTSALQSGDYPTLTAWLSYQLNPRCYPNPLNSTVTVPSISPDETPSNYENCLTTLGLSGSTTTLAETDTTVANADVTETSPESGDSVEPGTTVDIAVNPKTPQISEPDSRCNVDSKAGSPGDPGNPPSDGTNYPVYQLVKGSPYPAAVDPTGESPAQTQIPLRWGRVDWGWRHILQKHPYTSADEQQTMQALATDTAPTPGGFASTNQWDFHLFYTEPDGSGGTIQCLRTVRVEYYQDPKAAAVGVLGIRGIQNSYTGLYTSGLPGH